MNLNADSSIFAQSPAEILHVGTHKVPLNVPPGKYQQEGRYPISMASINKINHNVFKKKKCGKEYLIWL